MTDKKRLTEDDFAERLTVNERKIFNANQTPLNALRSLNDDFIKEYVEIAQLINELGARHDHYERLKELYDDDQVEREYFELTCETLFATIQVGQFSAVQLLCDTDDYEALYDYLTSIKINRFNRLRKNFDMQTLIEALN